MEALSHEMLRQRHECIISIMLMFRSQFKTYLSERFFHLRPHSIAKFLHRTAWKPCVWEACVQPDTHYHVCGSPSAGLLLHWWLLSLRRCLGLFCLSHAEICMSPYWTLRLLLFWFWTSARSLWIEALLFAMPATPPTYYRDIHRLTSGVPCIIITQAGNAYTGNHQPSLSSLEPLASHRLPNGWCQSSTKWDRLVFNSPNSLFLQSMLPQLLHENAAGDVKSLWHCSHHFLIIRRASHNISCAGKAQVAYWLLGNEIWVLHDVLKLWWSWSHSSLDPPSCLFKEDN